MVQQTKQCCRNNVLIFLISFTLAAAQNITLYSYKQSDSVTSCFTGLIQAKDRFVFHSDVDFKNASSDWSRIIGFQYKPPTSADFILFCLVDLRSVCSGMDGSNCYCNYTDTNGVYHIVIDATALTAFSNSLLRGYISYNLNPTSFSSSQVIPTIYDEAVSSKSLSVNGVDIRREICSLKLRPSNTNLQFCCTNAPSPCITRIFLNGLLLAGGVECAEYTATEVTDNAQVTFTFSHDVCGVADPMEYQCTALLECTTQCGWEGILLITIYTIVSATSIIVGIALFVFILNKWNNFTVLAFTCIQVSMLIISIIIIIIQALVDPCACDPDNSTITINIWAIFVINYFVVFSTFTITVVLVLLCMFYKSHENYLNIQRKLIFFTLNFTIVVPIFRMMLFLYRKYKRSISSNEKNPMKDKSIQTQIPHLKSGQKATVTFSNDKTSSIKTNSIEATFIDNNKKSDKKNSGKNVHTPMAENGHGKADPNNQKKENTNKDKNTTIEDKQTTRKTSTTKH